MPIIGRINAILLRMYYEDHAPPHFHGLNNEKSGLFSIEEGKMLKGNMTTKDQKTIEKWAEEHRAELEEMWNTQNIYKIEN